MGKNGKVGTPTCSSTHYRRSPTKSGAIHENAHRSIVPQHFNSIFKIGSCVTKFVQASQWGCPNEPQEISKLRPKLSTGRMPRISCGRRDYQICRFGSCVTKFGPSLFKFAHSSRKPSEHICPRKPRSKDFNGTFSCHLVPGYQTRLSQRRGCHGSNLILFNRTTCRTKKDN